MLRLEGRARWFVPSKWMLVWTLRLLSVVEGWMLFGGGFYSDRCLGRSSKRLGFCNRVEAEIRLGMVLEAVFVLEGHLSYGDIEAALGSSMSGPRLFRLF